MSYSLSSNFVPVEWLLAELWPLNLYFLFKFEVVRNFSWRPLIYWLDIWYVAISGGATVYVRISFRSNDFGWVMAIEHVYFVQIWSCPEFSLTSFDILTWYLVCGYIWMSYSLSSNFVPVEWLLADLWPLNLYFCSNVKLSGLFLDVLWYNDLIFGMWLYLDELHFEFEFRSGRLTFGWVMAIELVYFVQIWSCPDFSLTSFDILTWYLVCGYI